MTRERAPKPIHPITRVAIAIHRAPSGGRYPSSDGALWPTVIDGVIGVLAPESVWLGQAKDRGPLKFLLPYRPCALASCSEKVLARPINPFIRQQHVPSPSTTRTNHRPATRLDAPSGRFHFHSVGHLLDSTCRTPSKCARVVWMNREVGHAFCLCSHRPRRLTREGGIASLI